MEITRETPPAADPLGPCLPRARSEAVARAMAEPERALSYLARARRAAWLPELRLRVDRRVGRNESLDLPAGNVVATVTLLLAWTCAGWREVWPTCGWRNVT